MNTNNNHPNHNYEKLYGIAINQLEASNLYIRQLISIIEEIQALNKDKLIDKLIENWLERHDLDRLCHSRVLFED